MIKSGFPVCSSAQHSISRETSLNTSSPHRPAATASSPITPTQWRPLDRETSDASAHLIMSTAYAEASRSGEVRSRSGEVRSRSQERLGAPAAEEQESDRSELAVASAPIVPGKREMTYLIE